MGKYAPYRHYKRDSQFLLDIILQFMAVLCLDPSFSCLGWAVIDLESDSLYAVGTIELPKIKTQTISDRASLLAEALIEVINQYSPSLIIRESVVGSQSFSACASLNTIMGVIIGVASVRGIPLQSIPAKTAKKSLTGNKDATKADVINAVTKIYPDSILTNTKAKFRLEAICDAVALYITYKKDKIK